MHIRSCLWMQKNTDMKKIQTKYMHIHANTCTYKHIVTDLFLMYFCMYFGKIGVCMMRVFVCIVCICLYFLQEKLLGASIQTHSARYIRYIQNTSKNTAPIHTNTCTYIHQNLRTHFFASVFSLYVFCLYLFVLYLS